MIIVSGRRLLPPPRLEQAHRALERRIEVSPRSENRYSSRRSVSPGTYQRGGSHLNRLSLPLGFDDYLQGILVLGMSKKMEA